MEVSVLSITFGPMLSYKVRDWSNQTPSQVRKVGDRPAGRSITLWTSRYELLGECDVTSTCRVWEDFIGQSYCQSMCCILHIGQSIMSVIEYKADFSIRGRSC